MRDVGINSVGNLSFLEWSADICFYSPIVRGRGHYVLTMYIQHLVSTQELFFSMKSFEIYTLEVWMHSSISFVKVTKKIR
jgi:hypothetical protein